jgi:hypothetical protein
MTHLRGLCCLGSLGAVTLNCSGSNMSSSDKDTAGRRPRHPKSDQRLQPPRGDITRRETLRDGAGYARSEDDCP